MPEAAVAEPFPVAAPAVRQALRTGAAGLTDAGCETPRLDAELLLCAALGDGWTRARLLTADLEHLDPGAFKRYQRLIARRRAREPVAYIVGFKDFRRVRLSVDRRVLVPRPETELLVEVALTLPWGASVADVGTGSGAVALALKHERPDLELTGIDASPHALAVARANSRLLALDVRFAQADLLDDERYHAVLANLPYVPAGAGGLAPEITDHEPASALFGGADGLALVRRLISRLEASPVGIVALEVGAGQAPTVIRLLESAGFGSIQRARDLAGHERVVAGCR